MVSIISFFNVLTKFLYIFLHPCSSCTAFFIILQCVQLLQFVNIFHKSIWINYYITNFKSLSIWSDNSAVVQPGKFVVIRKIIRNTCQNAPFQPQGQFNITSRYLNCTIFYKKFLVYFKKPVKNFLLRICTWPLMTDYKK